MSKPQLTNPTNEQELRDWNAYFIWNNTHLLRTLKIELTPLQSKLVEEYSNRLAATVREDTGKSIQAERAKLKEVK